MADKYDLAYLNIDEIPTVTGVNGTTDYGLIIDSDGFVKKVNLGTFKA